MFNWLDSLKSTFGEYSYGGYSNDESIANEYQMRWIEVEDHYVSMHVIYYTTAISTIDLASIMNHTEKKGCSTTGVHPLCDPSVYSIAIKKDGTTSRQAFRHVLSDKLFRDERKNKSKYNRCFRINDSNKEELPASTHIIQVRGGEPIIEKDWEMLL